MSPGRLICAGIAACVAVVATCVSAVAGESSAAGRLATDTRTLAVGAPVTDIAADGPRIALLIAGKRKACEHVAVWSPLSNAVVRFRGRQTGCEPVAIGPLALAGIRVAWLWTTTTGNSVETSVIATTLARATPPWSYVAHVGASRDTGAGDFTRRPMGDRASLAFTVEHHCDPSLDAPPSERCPPGGGSGGVLASTLYRSGGPGPCIRADAGVRACTPVMQANGGLRVLAVERERIAVGAEDGVHLVGTDGRVLRRFRVNARAAALSGPRLAVRTADAVDVYDVATGDVVAHIPTSAGVRLADLEGDILVTSSGRTVTLRRLHDGRTIAIGARGVARAQLEQSGLFVAGGGYVTFTRMQAVLRRLGR